MTLPYYVIANIEGDDLIICTVEPHYIASVVHVSTDWHVAGGIYLQFNGTLAGNRLLWGSNPDEIMKGMIDFYKKEKI